MVTKSDIQIQADVLRELQWDHRVGATGITVSVDDGVVTLGGTVHHYARKIAAQQAAHRVAGVLDVANDIDVRIGDTEERTDTALAKAVRHALEWNVFTPDEQIRSTVVDGYVTLEGTVDTFADKYDAAAAVCDLAGVVGVHNRIAVRERNLDADHLRASIEQALERVAQREARGIDVAVSDGRVELTGRVHSWRERNAVAGTVRNAKGVTELVDRLRVDPSF